MFSNKFENIFPCKEQRSNYLNYLLALSGKFSVRLLLFSSVAVDGYISMVVLILVGCG